MLDNGTEHRVEENNMEKPVRVKIRLDFKGTGRSGKLLFGGKSQEKMAEENREQQVAMFRNIPLQGMYIEDIDTSIDVFSVYDDISNADVAYAPVVLTICADTLEDIISFITREEFRKIQILTPENFSLTRHEAERLFFRMHQQMQREISHVEKKYLK